MFSWAHYFTALVADYFIEPVDIKGMQMTELSVWLLRNNVLDYLQTFMLLVLSFKKKKKNYLHSVIE